MGGSPGGSKLKDAGGKFPSAQIFARFVAFCFVERVRGKVAVRCIKAILLWPSLQAHFAIIAIEWRWWITAHWNRCHCCKLLRHKLQWEVHAAYLNQYNEHSIPPVRLWFGHVLEIFGELVMRLWKVNSTEICTVSRFSSQLVLLFCQRFRGIFTTNMNYFNEIWQCYLECIRNFHGKW